MNEKMKYFLIGGVTLLILTILAETTLLNACTTNLACVGINLILFYPALLVSNMLNAGLTRAFDILVNAVFYFLLGGVIGLIIHKLRNK